MKSVGQTGFLQGVFTQIDRSATRHHHAIALIGELL
jgi:hypothetical protein